VTDVENLDRRTLALGNIRYNTRACLLAAEKEPVPHFHNLHRLLDTSDGPREPHRRYDHLANDSDPQQFAYAQHGILGNGLVHW